MEPEQLIEILSLAVKGRTMQRRAKSWNTTDWNTTDWNIPEWIRHDPYQDNIDTYTFEYRIEPAALEFWLRPTVEPHGECAGQAYYFESNVSGAIHVREVLP